MKALEKAAKDRGEAQPQALAAEKPAAQPAAAAKPPSPPLELSLEPLQADTPVPPPEEPPKPQPKSAAQIRAERNQARAATVMQATARPAAAAPATSRFRLSPVMALGLVAALIALGFAVYVYLQITNPALFIRKPPAPAPMATQPPPAPPVQAPIATGTVVAPATPAESAAAAAPRVQAEAPPRQPAPVAAPVAPAAAPARPSEAQTNRIQISSGSAEPQIDNRLVQAYAALQSGKTDAARQLYGDVSRSDPRNINALLGLAAIARQEGRTEDASRLYMSVLDLEPRNAYAQTGLIGIMGRADPLASESRLKQLITRDPSAALYFTLGNLYGDQARWAEAQQAYFQAHQLEAGNPDYTYNLAVSLEHIGQPKLAVNFYRQAVDQAQARGRAGFNLAQAQDRIRQLAAQQ
ncbi:MAG: tetratricopeptide repeat protein [Burkholderiales bacterium]|nr:tetratricopeptide repeat protein [Burkholderiales bacterium]